MKVISEVEVFWLSGNTVYYCARCGHQLKVINNAQLWHPDSLGLINQKQINCPYANKRCVKPSTECPELS